MSLDSSSLDFRFLPKTQGTLSDGAIGAGA